MGLDAIKGASLKPMHVRESRLDLAVNLSACDQARNARVSQGLMARKSPALLRLMEHQNLRERASCRRRLQEFEFAVGKQRRSSLLAHQNE